MSTVGISQWSPLSPPGLLSAHSNFSPLPGTAWLADVTCSQNPGAARPQAELGRGSQPLGSRRISYLGRAGVGREGSRRAPCSPQPSPCRRKGCRVGKEGERRKMGSHRAGGWGGAARYGWDGNVRRMQLRARARTCAPVTSLVSPGQSGYGNPGMKLQPGRSST